MSRLPWQLLVDLSLLSRGSLAAEDLDAAEVSSHINRTQKIIITWKIFCRNPRHQRLILFGNTSLATRKDIA